MHQYIEADMLDIVHAYVLYIVSVMPFSKHQIMKFVQTWKPAVA